MTHAELASTRLVTQQLVDASLRDIPALVRHMGAMQAQDFAMSKWAVGSRVPGTTEADIQTELDKGTILRTHVLRPTWHLVHAEDIRWMLELTGPQVKKLMNFTNKALGLTPEIYQKSTLLIESILATGEHLTREAIMKALKSNGLDTSSIRPAHYMMQAELDGIVCSGKMQGKQQTYALLAERAPHSATLKKEEARARLAEIFFSSHGPASAADFGWWSGLPAGDLRIALDEVRKQLEIISIEGINYYFNSTVDRRRINQPVVHLLPAFDELVISYKDRAACVTPEHQGLAFTKNGIFKPTVMVNGKAVGTWKRTLKKDTVLIETHYFLPPADNVVNLVSIAAEGLGRFLSKKIVVT